MFKPKDFIATEQGLVFAVVSELVERGRVLCFLRYALSQGQWRKVDTDTANQLLTERYPQYLFHSEKLDAHLHAVPVEQVSRHYRPRQRLAELMVSETLQGAERDCRDLCRLLVQHGVDLQAVGVTGSLLPAFQHDDSDIDLVFYGREVFQQGRNAIQALIEQGQCQPLSERDWVASYRRRNCDLSLHEYIWHERRKFNKTVFNRRKVDLNLIVDKPPLSAPAFGKAGAIKIRAKVIDDFLGFDYPAEWTVEHELAQTVLCFTATYTGQARKGEWIEVAGQLEVADDGGRRIVVGSNREARGEHIKVLHED